LLLSLPPDAIQQAIAETLNEDEAEALLYDWELWARDSQLPPTGSWSVWLVLAGRGFGKTRTGAEWVREQIRRGRKRIALVAPTAADARDVMVEGESGLLAIFPRSERPIYEPSKRRVLFAGGAMATLYSADEPERLRGPQHDAAWCDELGSWRYPEAWDMLMFGLRLGENPQAVVTTTPKPVPLVREILASATTAVTRGSTYENRANLAPSFLTMILGKYEGTRLGRQEIHAEVLDDVPGALWTQAILDACRVAHAPQLVRVAIGVDPSATAGEDSDETGIIVAGVGIDGHGYVFEDVTCKESPDGWGRRAVQAYHANSADLLVAEVNNGGDMVGHVIRTIDPNVNFKAVRATKGKVRRAEPVAALYEQGRVHHVGVFGALEDQMRMMTPAADLIDSPDRADALVWVLTELMVNVQRPVLYPEYRESLHVVDSLPVPMTRYMAILPTESGSHAMLWVGVDRWSDVYVYRELDVEGDYTLAECAEAIAAMEGAAFDIRHAGTTSEGAIVRPGVERIISRVLASNSEEWQLKYARYGIPCLPVDADPFVADDAIRAMLRPRQVAGRGEWPRLHVHRSCPQLLAELESLRAEPRDKGEAEPRLIECLRALASQALRHVPGQAQ